MRSEEQLSSGCTARRKEMKTKRATLNDMKTVITCTTDGEKDDWGKAIWFDADGKAYELMYARLARKYFFNRRSYYDKEV